MTPHSVHYGLAQAMRIECQAALDVAFLTHPKRFKSRRPPLAPLPVAAWINPPPLEQQPAPETELCTVNI